MGAGNSRIAVLLTSHNRREKTLQCLSDLHSQTETCASIEVFLVDDGSNDGTVAAVARHFPSVHLLQGDGHLYWTGGMRMAMDAASAGHFDFYLWLNDDTRLYSDAIQRLIRTHTEISRTEKTPSIVVGSIRDPNSGELTYGGAVSTNRWHPLRFLQIPPQNESQQCDVFNGNCVLIPRSVVERVGNLHPRLTHAVGDYEYALRAKKRNIKNWVAPGFFGECSRNSLEDTWKDTTVPLWQRYKKIFSVKGQPLGPRLIYYFNYGGPFWFALYPLVYLRPIADSLKNIFFFRKPS